MWHRIVTFLIVVSVGFLPNLPRAGEPARKTRCISATVKFQAKASAEGKDSSTSLALFNNESIPFGQTPEKVLAQIGGVKLAESGSSVFVGHLLHYSRLGKVVQKGLYEFLGVALYFNGATVKKYALYSTEWEHVNCVGLYFTEGKTGEYELFMVHKSLPEDHGNKYTDAFTAFARGITKEVRTKPIIRDSPYQTLADIQSGNYDPAKVGIWRTKSRTTMMGVRSSILGTVMQKDVFYLSKKGWRAYLKANRRHDAALKNKSDSRAKKDMGDF